jgi:hypothetical protein
MLQTAAGAALLAGPLRMLGPAPARAAESALDACRDTVQQETYDAFQACVKGPLDAFESARESLDHENWLLSKGATPRQRRLIKKRIARYKRDEAASIKQLEDCNAKWHYDFTRRESQCYDDHPRGGGGTSCRESASVAGCGGAPANGGCDAGYILCGQDCCDTTYAHCGGCAAQPVCCRNGATCCAEG